MRFFWAVAALLLCVCQTARADVFNLPRFVSPGEFAIGLEPELTLTSGAGLGVNLRYTQGLTDFFNASGIIGTGSGPRQFRAGGDLDLDIFPDVGNQPGIGIAGRALYIRVPSPGGLSNSDTSGTMELTAIPYIHKALSTESGSVVDPFFALPFGTSLGNGATTGLTTAVVGALFKGGDHFWFSTEFGIAVNHTDTYFAGGVAYYH